MNHTLFETTNHAQELLTEAIGIWRQSDESERLEGLEKDPVFGLLMSAVAYQSIETNSEIERLKSELIEEYASTLVPYELGHATPASILLETAPAAGQGSVELNADSHFIVGTDSFVFTPLLNSKVVEMSVKKIVRLDGRRWKIDLQFEQPIEDLGGITFCLSSTTYRDLRITFDDQELPLVRPWEYSELPMSDIFSLDNFVLNQQTVFDPMMTCMDLFARHNVNFYCIKTNRPETRIKQEVSHLSLVFEFFGIPEDFRFSAAQIHFNTTILVNASRKEVTLDKENPIARVAGSTTSGNEDHVQFMHMLRPNTIQLYAREPVTVRRIMADRFNQGALIKLLSSLICKLQSDFYAFHYLNAKKSQYTLNALKLHLQKLVEMSREKNEYNISGTYLMVQPDTEASLSVPYVITNGTAVNQYLDNIAGISCPPVLDKTKTRQIGEPVAGSDEVNSKAEASELVRYAIASNDRIVTPADIRRFCYKELQLRYGIIPDMIIRFDIGHQLAPQPNYYHNACGYEIKVNMILGNSNYVKRSFADRIPQTEILLEKMMQVRSANIYPISVKIDIE